MTFKKIKSNIFFLFFSSFLIYSCADNINDSRYRNTNYAYYQKQGEKGEWRKIVSNSDFKPKQGKLTYFFSDGVKYGEIEIADSINSIEKSYDKEGKLSKTAWIKSDSVIKVKYENGYFKYYHSNFGALSSEGKVANNLQEGEWKRYRKEDGSLEKVFGMKSGLEHGKRVEYWKNGNIKSVTYWDMDKQIGEAIYYYENGNIKETNFVLNKQLHGICKEYYENGILESEENFWNGKRKDTCKYYFEDGQLKILQIYKLDTISLTHSVKQFNYYPNGKIQAKSNFNDSGQGIVTLYYENGNIKEWSEKKEPVHNGKIILYYESGKKYLEGQTKNGSLNGKINYFSESGKLTKTVQFDYGIAKDSILY